MQQFLLGEKLETKGHHHLENEGVVGSSDKIMFNIKEFNSDFNRMTKVTQNPFLVAKLDLPSIKIFNFPMDTLAHQNPYNLKRNGLLEGKSVSIAIAEQKFKKPEQFYREYVKEFAAINQHKN